MRLHQVADHFRAFLDALPIDPDTGEALDEEAFAEAAASLERAELDLNRRVESLGLLLVEIEAEADAAATEVERLKRLERTRRKRADRLSQYLLTCIDAAGLKRAGGSLLSCSVRLNPPSVEITGEVPEALLAPQKPAPPRTPDKRAILDAWKRDPASVEAFAAVARGKRLVVS